MDTGAEVGDKQKLADFVACPFQGITNPGMRICSPSRLRYICASKRRTREICEVAAIPLHIVQFGFAYIAPRQDEARYMP